MADDLYLGAFLAKDAELTETKRVLEGRIAQLEDELAVANQNVSEAYEFTKPPINIDTSTNNTAGGDLALPAPPDNSKTQAIVVLTSVLGFVLTLWLLLKSRKGK